MTTEELNKKRQWLENVFDGRFDMSVKEKNGVIQGTYVNIDFTGYKIPRKYKDVDEFLVVCLFQDSFVGMSGSMNIISLPYNVVK